MNIREAAQQALEALQGIYIAPEHDHYINAWWPACRDAIPALRAALAEDAMQRLTDVQQEMESASRESRQVEPVAYVTGYSKGYATVRPIYPCLLMPVGMALYRSPPTISKTETVEPVAYSYTDARGRTVLVSTNTAPYEDAKPLYSAPPKREPLTDAEIGAVAADIWGSILIAPQSYQQFARAIEQAHEIVE